MQEQEEIEEWRHQLNSTQVQIYSPHYSAVWDSDRLELTYTRNKDGQQLFIARKQDENNWDLEQPEGITADDVSYHRAINQQRQPQRTPTREVDRNQGWER